MSEVSTVAAVERPEDPWQPLLHRWFVEYNPFYLVSAALVLGGLTTVSRGLAQQGDPAKFLIVAALAEVYAWSLIGGAALLMRSGQRRPAVLLGLLAIVYQSDLTLHVETCGLLGLTGVGPAALWFGMFVGKLSALAAALRARIERRSLAAAAFGALGLAAIPFAIYRLNREVAAGNLVALFVFATLAALPRDLGAGASSREALDGWGKTVLRRVSLAAWGIWGAALALHVAFWSAQVPLATGRVLVAALAFAVARQRGLLLPWGFAALTLTTAALMREPLGFFALLMALMVVYQAFAWFEVKRSAAPAAAPAESPYRAGEAAAPRVEEQESERVFEQVSVLERRRLLGGGLFLAYLAAWLWGYRGGPLPAHELPLDLSLTLLSGLMAWRSSGRLGLALSSATLTHAAAASGLVPRPRSLIEWGALMLLAGFALLGGSLAVSSWLARRSRPGAT